MVGGLVQDQEIGLGEHELGQGYTSSFAAGKRGDFLKNIISGKEERRQHVADLRLSERRVGVGNLLKNSFVAVEYMMFLVIITDLHFGAQEKLPMSADRRPLSIFSIVVLPVPLFPIRATRSPLFIWKETFRNNGWPGKLLARFSTVRTSFPLTVRGSSERRICVWISAGFSTR